MQKYILYFKDKGPKCQRSLALFFSVTGYLLVIVAVLFTRGSTELYVTYLEYLLCGIGILVLKKLFHFRASGHCCGIVGPVILLCYFGLYICALCGALITALVYYAGIKTRQHSVWQLIGGSILPVVVITVLKLIFG